MSDREEQAKREQWPELKTSVRGDRGESRTDHLC